MQTLESLRNRINSIEDLHAVIRTMKALALVSIRQYEKACLSLADYTHTIELGLQAWLRCRHFSEISTGLFPLATATEDQGTNDQGVVGVIILGSEHGLCGQFNEQIITYTFAQIHQSKVLPERCLLAAIGTRLISNLETTHQPLHRQFPLPSSLAGMPSFIQNLLSLIESWCFHESSQITTSISRQTSDQTVDTPSPDVSKILLFYNKFISATTYQPTTLQLFPLDRGWLSELETRPWHSPTLPTFSMAWESLLAALIRQYLFVTLYRATVESLASENTARLLSMQAAEKNIDDRLLDLNTQYRQQRQNTITGELLDIVAGFEALTKHP